MPPRKSLPAPSAVAHRSTPRRGQSSTPQKPVVQPITITRKRQRPTELDDDLESIEADPIAPAAVRAGSVKPEPASGAVMDPEKELEHWQDFAVEHYEMVEQLPLELHRNYRLLRELDDGVAEKLQNAMREYIAHRLSDIAKPVEPAEATSPSLIPPLPSLSLDGSTPPVGNNEQVTPPSLVTGEPLSNGQEASVPAPEPAEAADTVIAVEQSVAESERGPPADSVPLQDPAQQEADDPSLQLATEDQLVATSTVTKKENRGWPLLSDISRLAKEMVKNGEEKVAVAQGAYNSIDRHIRALDSALSAQEASILLGLRPSTLPSTAVENGLENGESGAKVDVDETTIGTGGGGARRKGRAARGRGRGRGGASAGGRGGDMIVAAPVDAVVIPPEFADADPNEPRYCYCNQVSYGEMMACDNDDCPIEWFHIACAGFTAAPTGNWLCNICSPNTAKGPGKTTGTPARGTNKGARGRARGRQTR